MSTAQMRGSTGTLLAHTGVTQLLLLSTSAFTRSRWLFAEPCQLSKAGIKSTGGWTQSSSSRELKGSDSPSRPLGSARQLSGEPRVRVKSQGVKSQARSGFI